MEDSHLAGPGDGIVEKASGMRDRCMSGLKPLERKADRLLDGGLLSDPPKLLAEGGCVPMV